jgi:hypothetical protein
MRAVYETIREVVESEHGMICRKADDIRSDGVIIDEIWTSICSAQMVIAEASGRNANVFYEMGLAHAIGKHVIIITDSVESLPFDLRHRRVVSYDPSALDSLRESLSKTVMALKWVPPVINQWVRTDKSDVRVGLAWPVHGTRVHKSPIEASGRIVGLPRDRLRCSIQGFVITDTEYQQGTGWIDAEGYWRTWPIHLGATEHRLFFRIRDEADRPIATSDEILVTKTDPVLTSGHGSQL